MFKRRITRAATLAVATPVLAAAALAAHGGGAQAATAPSRSVIATATAHDLRFDVAAERTSSGPSPTASVYVVAYGKSGGAWHRVGELRLGARDGWFWNVLNGPRAVRELEISNAVPDHGSTQLLVTPALGWSPTYHFRFDHGRLVP